MKLILPLIICIFSVLGLQAQIISGEKLGGNIVATDIEGNQVDIFKELDAGRSVVIDVFATWCGPCWSFHNSGYLKNLNKALGPDGTNQIRIYAIEADSLTPLSNIYQAVAGSTGSLGDWTKDVDYSIINSEAFNTLLKVAFFPTLYIIRPDRTVMEMGNFRFNTQVWEKALLPTADKDLIFTTTLDDKSFCSIGIFNQKPKVMNMGKTPVAALEAELLINGASTVTPFTRAIGVFQEAEISFGNRNFNEPTDIQVNITSVDGVVDEEDALSVLKASFIKPVVEEKTITVKFTTDFYPAEVSWNLKDNKNRTLKTVTYQPGNEDQFGGGGADANKEHEYEIPINNIDINCLTLTITDSYGDGMTAFNAATNPFPGVELYTSTGELLKPKLSTEYSFTSSAKVFASASITSALDEQDFVENLNVYPNPVSDVLNIDMKLAPGLDYEVFITDITGTILSNVQKNTSFLNVSELSGGMYFLNVKTAKGIFAHKFTKI